MSTAGSTYSIVGYDPERKEWGIAVQSKFLAVGALVPWVREGVGAVATQSMTNTNFGTVGVRLLEEGKTLEEAYNLLMESDEGIELRQFAIMDHQGNVMAHTGKGCVPYAGHRLGKNYACQGNMLLGDVVINKMAEAFENHRGDLSQGLFEALEAGQQAGGDRRGRQAAAILVKSLRGHNLGFGNTKMDLRVDDHLDPIGELKRLIGRHRVIFSENFRDRWIPFEGEVKEEVQHMMIFGEIIKNSLATGDTLEKAIRSFAKGLGMSGKEVFREGWISGEVIDRITKVYYQKNH